MEPTTSLATQQGMVMVELTVQTILYLASMEPATSAKTLQPLVVQSAHQTIVYLTSMEPATLSVTQHVMEELSLQLLTVH